MSMNAILEVKDGGLSGTVRGFLKSLLERKLVDGLLRIYQDNGVDGYYDRSLLESYRTRYLMFIMVVVSTGVVGAIVPFFL